MPPFAPHLPRALPQTLGAISRPRWGTRVPCILGSPLHSLSHALHPRCTPIPFPTAPWSAATSERAWLRGSPTCTPWLFCNPGSDPDGVKLTCSGEGGYPEVRARLGGHRAPYPPPAALGRLLPPPPVSVTQLPGRVAGGFRSSKYSQAEGEQAGSRATRVGGGSQGEPGALEVADGPWEWRGGDRGAQSFAQGLVVASQG